VSTRVSGTDLRRAGGLRSTWITQLVTLSATRPGGAVVHGGSVVVTGRAQGAKGAVLQQRVDGAWKPIGGTGLKARVKAAAPTGVRIVAGKLVGPVLKIPVAPRVTARAGGAGVVGRVVPHPPGTTVELQLEGERGWTTTMRATTGPEGGYSLVPATPGVYRVRVAPVAGFAAGLSAPIELP
jgi:hypothetical protein